MKKNILFIILLIAFNLYFIYTNIKLNAKKIELNKEIRTYKSYANQFNYFSNYSNYKELIKGRDIKLNYPINLLVIFQDMSCSSCNRIVIENLNKLNIDKGYVQIIYSGNNLKLLGLNKLNYKILQNLKLKDIDDFPTQPIIFVVSKTGDILLIHQVIIGHNDITNRFFNTVNILYSIYIHHG